MKSLNVDKYVLKYMFGKDKKILQFAKFIEDHCKELEKGILTQNEEISLKLVYEYLYVVNTVYKNIGLLQLINGETFKELKNANNSIELLQEKFYSNVEIFEKLVKNKKTPEKILKKFILKQNPTIDEIQTSIKNLEQKIQSQLLSQNLIPVSKNIKSNISGIPNVINLSRQTYYYLQRNVYNAREREILEHHYMTHANKSLKDLAKLIIERHKFAVLSGSPTYFNLIKKKTSNENTIKSDIEDLISKIDLKSRKEIDRIYRNLKTDKFDKKVDTNDIVYYCEKFKTKLEFTPNHVIKCLITLINKYFGIQFIEQSNVATWHENNIVYKVGFGKELFGYCCVDLEKRESKEMKSPICVHLCQQYTNLENKTFPTKIGIIANYTNLNIKCMTLSDVIYLFREFGYAIQMLSYKSSNGIYILNEEFDILMPQIMECILWERETVELLCSEHNNIEDVIDNMLFTRHLQFAHSIKIKCINALFDHVIHNSQEFIKFLKSVEESEHENLLISTYKKIYENIMFSQQDILNTNISGINPTVIQQEVNGSAGLVYCNIYTEILSFSIFHNIRSKIINGGEQFIQNVMRANPSKIKTKLEEFISKNNSDSYNIYLRELIGYNEIDTEMNNNININISKINNKNTKQMHTKIKTSLPTIVESSANKYDDSDHSNDNIENVIRIDRKP